MEGLGAAGLRALIDRHGSGRAALAAPARESTWQLQRVRRISVAELSELLRGGTRIVSYGAPGYPVVLTRLHRPPPILFLRGPLPIPDRGLVAIVGTRRATEYGLRVAYELAFDLASEGVTVVSGLAAGIDGSAHRGALAADGDTLGVLGCGLAHVYPRQHRRLYEAVRQRGLLVTEFEPAVLPSRSSFPRRNRIIAGLCDLVVVVQAGARSGALITVDHALELGVEVGAVPGPVSEPCSVGVHRLLRDGAHVITAAEEVLELLPEASRRAAVARRAAQIEAGSRSAPSAVASGATDSERAASGNPDSRQAGPESNRDQVDGTSPVLRRLRRGACEPNELVAVTGLDVGKTLALLSRLEIMGWIRRLPDGRFCAGESTWRHRA